MYVYVYIYIYTNIHICTYIYIHIYIYIYTYIYIYVGMYVCIYQFQIHKKQQLKNIFLIFLFYKTLTVKLYGNTLVLIRKFC